MMPECQFFPTLAGNRWNGYRFQNNCRPSRCPLREIRKTAVKWPPTEAAILAVPINLESEFGLENGAGFVPDLDCHPVPKDMPTPAPNGIFGHVGQGSRGFFLHRFDIRQFHTFLVRGDNVAVSQVEKGSLHNNIERRET